MNFHLFGCLAIECTGHTVTIWGTARLLSTPAIPHFSSIGLTESTYECSYSPHPWQHLSLDFLILTIPVDIKDYLTMGLICVSTITNYIEYLFMCCHMYIFLGEITTFISLSFLFCFSLNLISSFSHWPHSVGLFISLLWNCKNFYT